MGEGGARKTEILKQSVVYSLFNYGSIALGFLVSLLSKRWLGVAGAGYWTLLTVAQTFSMYVGLGIKDALEREVPQKRGAGLETHAQHVQDVTYTYLVLASLAVGLVLWISSEWFFHDPIVKTGLKIIALLVLMTHLYNTVLTILRAKKQFTIAGRVISMNMLFVACFALTGAYLFNVLGFAVGMVVATACSSWLAKRLGRIRLAWRMDWRELCRLLRIGSVVLVSGVLFKTFLDMDKIMIGKMLGPEALGLYAVGLMVLRQAGALPRFSNIVIFPYMQERYGATQDQASLKSMLVRPMWLASCVMPCVLGCAIFVFQALVHHVIPQFIGGLEAMKILVLGYFFIPLGEMASALIFTVNRQKILNVLYLPLVPLSVGLDYLVIIAGWGIVGVAMATTLAYMGYFLIVSTYAARRLMAWNEWRSLLSQIGLSFTYFVGSVLVIDRMFQGPGVIMATLGKMGLLLTCQAPLLILAERREQLWSTLWRMGLERLRHPAVAPQQA